MFTREGVGLKMKVRIVTENSCYAAKARNKSTNGQYLNIIILLTNQEKKLFLTKDCFF